MPSLIAIALSGPVCLMETRGGWLGLKPKETEQPKGKGWLTNKPPNASEGGTCVLSFSLSKQAPCFNSPMQQQLSQSHSPSERVHPWLLRMLPGLCRQDTESWSPLQAVLQRQGGNHVLGREPSSTACATRWMSPLAGDSQYGIPWGWRAAQAMDP